MKRLLSVILSLSMLIATLSVCCITAAAAGTNTIKNIVAMKPTDNNADYTTYRFIFDVTKAGIAALNNGNEVIPGGFEAVWGIGSGDNYGAYAANWGNPNHWGYDENNDLYIQVSFDQVGMNAGEEYAAAAAGTLKGFIKDISGSSDCIHDTLKDNGGRVQCPDLIPNSTIDGAQSIIRTLETEENYYVDYSLKLSANNLQINDDGNRLIYMNYPVNITFPENSTISYNVYTDVYLAGLGGIDPEDGGTLRDSTEWHDTYHPSVVDVSDIAYGKWGTRSFALAGTHISQLIFAAEGTPLSENFNVYYRDITIYNSEGRVIWEFNINNADMSTASVYASSDSVKGTNTSFTKAEVDPANSVVNAPKTVTLNTDNSFSFDVAFKGATSFDTWFGIYPASQTTFSGESTFGAWGYFRNGLRSGVSSSDGIPADGTINISSANILSENYDIGRGTFTAGEKYIIVMFYNDTDRNYDIIASDAFTFSIKAVGASVSIDNCDSAVGWDDIESSRSGIDKVDTSDFKEGTGCLISRDTEWPCIIRSQVGYNLPLAGHEDIRMWLYISDTSLITSNSILELSKSVDGEETNFALTELNLSNGWNDITIPVSKLNFDTLNYIRLWVQGPSSELTLKLDDIRFINAPEIPVITNPATPAQINALVTAKTKMENNGIDIYSDNSLYKAAYNNAVSLLISDNPSENDIVNSTNLLNIYTNELKTISNGNISPIYVKPCGRTYYKNSRFNFNFTCAGFEARFYGSSVTAQIYNRHVYNTRFNVYIDGSNTKSKEIMATDGSHSYELASGLTEGIHTVKVIKLTEVDWGGQLGLESLSCDGKLLSAPKKSSRSIEFIGDSNATAYGNLARGGDGYNADQQDGSKSFGYLTAQALGADVSIFAKSGICCTSDGAIDGNSTLDTYLYTDYWNCGSGEKYDFAADDYDVVAVHIGDNDFDGKLAPGKISSTEFKRQLKLFYKEIREANPNSYILAFFSIEGSSNYTSRYPLFRDVVSQLNNEGDNRISFLEVTPMLSSEGVGPSGHPTDLTHARIAGVLTNEINRIMGWNSNGITNEVYCNEKIEGGSVSASTDFARAGDTVTLTVDSDNFSFYNEDSLKIYAGTNSLSLTKVNDTTYTFVMPSVMVSVNASFTTVTGGDIDEDSEITSIDALCALLQSIDKITLTAKQKAAADVNQDSVINAADAMLILQHTVNYISEFPQAS